MAITKHSGQHDCQRHEHPRAKWPSGARQHCRQRRGAEHQHETHAVATRQVGHLNQSRPVILRMRDAGHVEPRPDMRLGQFKTSPNDRHGQDERPAQSMHGHARSATNSGR